MPRDIKGYPRALSFQNQRLVKDEERGSCPLHVLLLPCRNFEDPGGGSSKEGKMRDSLHPPSSTQSDLRASSPKHSAPSHHIPPEASTNSNSTSVDFS